MVEPNSEESESDDGTVTIREDVLSFSQEEYHNLFVPKNPFEIEKGLQNTVAGIAALVPPQLEDFFLPRPQHIVYHPRLEMLAKAAGISIKDLVKDLLEKQRKGEVEKEAYMKAYYLRQAFCENINSLGLRRDRSNVLFKISVEIALFMEPEDWHNSSPAVFHLEKLAEAEAYSRRHRLLQLISEHVTKFLALQDDLGSDRQLLNDNLNSIPDHKPNTRLHTLAIFFAHMIALQKVSDHTAAAAAVAAAAPSPTYLQAQRYLHAATTATAAAASTPAAADATTGSLLSLDTLVETAVESINKGVIPKKLIEQLAVRFTSNKNLDSLRPMSIPLNRDTTKNTVKGGSIGNFHWEGALKSFALLRLKTAHAVRPGKKKRPYGYTPKLAAELNAFAQKYKIPLPSGSNFIRNMVERVDREADSERTKKYKAAQIEGTNVRKADPMKRKRAQEIKKLYDSSIRGKDKKRKWVANKEKREVGIPQPKLPHIDSLRLESLTIKKFIRNQKKRDCDSLTLQELIERPLNHIFLDINGSSRNKPDQIRDIAAYSVQQQCWLIIARGEKNKQQVQQWHWITFKKDNYVPYVPGEDARESKRAAWDKMDARPGSERRLDLSLDEVQEKLKEFIGDKICIDCNGCDNRCLGLWNDNLFGMENKEQFDFGMTVLFGGKHVKSIFGPRTKEGEETNTNKIIHSVTGNLHIITDDLFVLNGRSWSKPVVPGSLCDPYLTCVSSDLDYSDVVLDVQRLINLFVAIRTANNHTTNNE